MFLESNDLASYNLSGFQYLPLQNISSSFIRISLPSQPYINWNTKVSNYWLEYGSVVAKRFPSFYLDICHLHKLVPG